MQSLAKMPAAVAIWVAVASVLTGIAIIRGVDALLK